MDLESANQRYYQLQIKADCPLKCSYCPGLGLVSKQERLHNDIVNSLRKAQSGNYSAVLIPCNALDSQDLPLIIETIHRFSLIPIVQIN